MEVNPETGSEDENQSFDQLPFFSAFTKDFKDMKETLAERVSSALENELAPTLKEVTPASSDILDSSVCTLDSGDEDDVPLIKRLQKEVHDDTSPRRTRSSRRGGRGGRKKTVLSKAPPEATSEVIVLSDMDDGDEVLCIDAFIDSPKTHVLSTVDLNVSESADILEDSEEDDNAPVSVKINWMNLKMHRFELPKNQTFSTVFEELAKKENVPVDKILLILRDKIFISKDDSPQSLNITVVDLIEGGVTKEVNKNASNKSETNKNMLEFKCVLKDQKKPLLVSIRKVDSMHCLMVKAAEQLGCPLEKLKFKFEGEELEGEATPEDLDLEGGEVIEVFVKS